MCRNGDIITFKTQDIYKNNNSFKRAMHQLHDKGFILFREVEHGNEYTLTDKGKVLGLILNEYNA